MSPKAIIIVGMILAVLPFIIYSFLSDLTKRQFVLSALFLFAIGCAASTGVGQTVFSWLERPEHSLPILFFFGLFLIGVFSAQVVMTRRRRRQLTWGRRPSQAEFSEACCNMLTRAGWEVGQDINTAFFNIYWMKYNKERITFIFSVNSIEIGSILRALNSSRATPTKKVLIVLWEQPLDSMLTVLDQHGWRFMTLDNFKSPEADLTKEVKTAARSVSSEPHSTSWSSLKGGSDSPTGAGP